MKIDAYTKLVLTVIAVALAVIAVNPYTHLPAVVEAQTSAPTPVQFAVGPDGTFYFFNPDQNTIYGVTKQGVSLKPLPLH
jgi:hypothetical protein